MRRVRLSLELSLRTDFADIVELKSKRRIRKGNVKTEWHPETSELINTYEHDEFRRSVVSRLIRSSSTAYYSNGRITFLIDLEPQMHWHTCCQHTFRGGRGGEEASQRPHPCVHVLRNADNPIEQELSSWKKVTTSNEDVYRLFRQSVEDMAALRLPQTGEAQNEIVPAAGVPWFVAVFGRDSLIVSLQNLIVYPDFARGALDVPGKLQAREIDDYRDAQPGKILHEIRRGELAERKLIPHTPYYGTADATALYLITLCEAWKWLGDDSLFLQPGFPVCRQGVGNWLHRSDDGMRRGSGASHAMCALALVFLGSDNVVACQICP